MAPRRSKRARILRVANNNNNGPEPKSPFETPELREHMFSYLPASDLCNVDLASRDCRSSAKPTWNRLAQNQFGLVGKEGWITGNSYLKKTIFVDLNDDGDFGYGESLMAQNTHVATNQSILVAVADDVDAVEDFRTFPVEQNGICLRDAYSLSYFRTVSSPIINMRATICGKTGCEVIVTSNHRQVAAQRGDEVQLLHEEYDWNGYEKGIPIAGCPTHLIAAPNGRVFSFRVAREDGASLLALENSAVLPVVPDVSQFPKDICWSPDMSQFAICCSHVISVWNFYATSGDMSLNLVIRAVDDESIVFGSVALAERFVVTSDDNKKIVVFDLESGQKLYTLCDADEDEELDEDEDEDNNRRFDPVCMSVVGHLLVSSSHLGNALCVWDLKTGQLLVRHEDAFEHICDQLPAGVDAASMVFLRRLNAFVTFGCSLFMWGFPTNKRMEKMLQSIRRRERNLKRVHFNLRQGEMVGDNAEENDGGSDDDCDGGDY